MILFASLSGLFIIVLMKMWQVVRELQHSRNGVLVTTEDDCTYQANYLILSASIGVLQSDLISFKPPLPVRMTSYQYSIKLMLVIARYACVFGKGQFY